MSTTDPTPSQALLEEDPNALPDDSMVIIDLGKKKRKRVKNLRKGRGQLAAQVRESIEDMVDEGVLGADAQIVVVVVEKKRKKLKWPRWAR